MTHIDFLVLLTLGGWAWGALVLTRLHDARNERDMYRHDAAHNRAVSDVHFHRAETLAKELIAAHVTVVAAQKAMDDAFDQRDDMQRRLAAATWPIKGDVNA